MRASQPLPHGMQGFTLFYKKKKIVSIVKIALKTLWDKQIFKYESPKCQAELSEYSLLHQGYYKGFSITHLVTVF